jgi:hypothetical protein
LKRVIRQNCRVIGLVCVLLAAGGCTLLGGAVYKATGPAGIPARYVPANRPTLILVENYVYAPDGSIESERIGQYLADDLKEEKVAPLVDLDKLNHIRDADPDGYKKMTIAEIGQAAGAAQVIYINLKDFSVEAPLGSDKIKGTASVRVKVVDAASGQSLWPLDAADGEPLADETAFKPRDPNGGDTNVRDELCKSLATKIGHFFHEWQPDSDQPPPGTGFEQPE